MLSECQHTMQLNIGILILVLCLASSLVGIIGNTCPKSQSTWAKACRQLFGWTQVVLCLASCVLMLIGPFRGSVTL